jgi:hypothetical protein
VFLSYASQDADAARRICDALRAAGIEVWFDQSELRGGEAWDRRIRDQIRHCALFIAIISGHSQARLEGTADASARLKAENGGDSAFFVAEVYAFRGQKDPAFEWLDRAFVQRDNSLHELKGVWLLKNLEGDPRYQAFLRKMNLPE